MEIIGKTNELSKEDQNPFNFIQKHIRDNAETLEKITFKVYEELLINMRKKCSGKISRIPQKNEAYNALLSTRGHIVAKDIPQISLAPMRI
ncbi:hypothetical protein HZS_3808 [Henneguya salminicola]|nr:hypothetical protein HZS_3808 [Henneguya salminicola]